MTDEPSSTTAAEDTTTEESSHGALATVLLAFFVIVLILIFWRSCGAQDSTGDTGSSGGSIQTIDDLERAPGGIAVWVKPGSSIEEVLGRHGLADTSVADMGDGTYVIGVAEEDQEATVEELQGDSGLYDAGFVYVEE